MSDHYHDENDLKLMREMRKLAGDDFNAWLGLNNAVGRENGAIPKKYRELIAIAVACTTQCPYCIEAHSKAAKAAGASREEVVEAAFVAAALRAGARGDSWRDGAQIFRSGNVNRFRRGPMSAGATVTLAEIDRQRR